MSRAAARWVARRGGRVYVWSHTLNDDFAMLQTATAAPADGAFVLTATPDAYRIQVWQSEQLAALDGDVAIHRRFLLPGIEATSPAGGG